MIDRLSPCSHRRFTKHTNDQKSFTLKPRPSTYLFDPRLTHLFPPTLTVLQKAFNSFDSSKTGSISTETVAEILRLMGQPFNKKILDDMIEEVDEDSEYK